MAFVNQSKRELSIHENQDKKLSVEPEVGPGSYIQENQKDISFFTKKLAPFTSTEARKVNESQTPKVNGPGPGSYQSIRSDFSKTLAAKGIGENRQYLVNDNGHINQRTQKYIPLANTKAPDTYQQSIVGPGSYETSVSQFERLDVSGPIINAHRDNQSPRIRAAAVNPGLLKLSSPSIPSKLFSPVIDTSQNDSYSTQIVQNDFCQIQKLLNDPAKVGPGTYNTSGDIAKQPKLVLNWTSPSGNRLGVPKQHDQWEPSVGPGSYTIQKIDKKPQSMFLPRQGIRNNSGIFTTKINSSSIRDNHGFDEDQFGGLLLSKKPLPGPGDYLTERSSFTNIGKPRDYQFFGSNVERFKTQSVSNQLGPGQYKLHQRNKSSELINGTSQFKSVEGRVPYDIQFVSQLPGPGYYMPEKQKEKIKSPKATEFGVKQKRFSSDETEVPGPGSYKATDSCVVKEPNRNIASQKSVQNRNLYNQKDTPGVGQYNANENYSLSARMIQGGAPNNFTVLSQQKNPFIHDVKIKESPRLPETVTPTPVFVGPGSYSKQKPQFAIKRDILPQQPIGGRDLRFKMPIPQSPPVGEYNDLNKWNKRTFNLKFLNGQAQQEQMEYVQIYNE